MSKILLLIFLCATIANAAPGLGVYVGAAPYGPNRMDSYNAWLGSKVVYGMEFEADDSWDTVSGQDWWLKPWSEWVNSAPAGETRNFVISVPMLPLSPQDANIAAGAKGDYNSYFNSLGQKLVQYKLANAYLRIGWEFNGDWFKWSAKAGNSTWVAFFNNIASTMKSVPGNNFKVIWCVNAGYTAADATQCYPDSKNVDFIGVDTYDVDWTNYNWGSGDMYGEWNSSMSYKANSFVEHNVAVWKSIKDNSNVEPGVDSSTWTLIANPTKLTQLRANAWDNLYTGHLGMKFWSDFAKSHGKPMTFNEWGIWAQTHGGFDNDYYIQKMHDFLFDPTNNVAFFSYFDVFAFDGDHKLQPPTQFPRSSKKFQQLFSGL